MAGIGEVLRDSIFNRIKKGLNAEDAPAKPLKPGRGGRRGYPDYKSARGLQPIRDWTRTGRTMRSMKVLSASENKGTIGFSDAVADARAHFNNMRERAFAISPNDREKLVEAVKETARGGGMMRAAQVA